VPRLRQAWPGVEIHVRGDSGLAVPEGYECCERLGLYYALGYGSDTVLRARTEAWLEELQLYYRCRWTTSPLLGIVRLAVGRIGLRRRATRAPGGRRYPRSRGLRHGGPAFQPVMDRSIHLDQLAEAGAAWSSAAMRIASPLPLPESFLDEPAAKRLRKNVPALLGQLFAGEGGAEVGVALSGGLENLLPLFGIGAMIGRLATQFVGEGLVALSPQAALQASDVADGEAEQACGFRLGTLTLENTVENFANSVFLLTQGDPAGRMHVGRQGSSLAWARRTFLSR
jgi:hypothetical protein